MPDLPWPPTVRESSNAEALAVAASSAATAIALNVVRERIALSFPFAASKKLAVPSDNEKPRSMFRPTNLSTTAWRGEPRESAAHQFTVAVDECSKKRSPAGNEAGI